MSQSSQVEWSMAAQAPRKLSSGRAGVGSSQLQEGHVPVNSRALVSETQAWQRLSHFLTSVVPGTY